MKKKTYIFDDNTLDMIDHLKCELNQKEVVILKEAIRMLYESKYERKKKEDLLNEIVRKLDYIVRRIEDLSFELGKCKERNKYLEDKLKRFMEDYNNE